MSITYWTHITCLSSPCTHAIIIIIIGILKAPEDSLKNLFAIIDEEWNLAKLPTEKSWSLNSSARINNRPQWLTVYTWSLSKELIFHLYRPRAAVALTYLIALPWGWFLVFTLSRPKSAPTDTALPTAPPRLTAIIYGMPPSNKPETKKTELYFWQWKIIRRIFSTGCADTTKIGPKNHCF